MTSHEVKVIWKEKWSGNWQEIYIDKLKHKYTGWKQKNKIPKWKKNENCPKFTKLKWELKTFSEITVMAMAHMVRSHWYQGDFVVWGI